MRGVAILALLASTLSAASWIRISSPSVEIYTDCGESQGRALLDRFQTLHRIFRESYPVESSDTRLRVFLFFSEREFQDYRPNPTTAAFYENDSEGDFIVLNQNVTPERNAAHEYLHKVMHHSSGVLPHWVEEGLAEFYSTVSARGTKVTVGAPIQAHLSRLEHEQWLSAEDLASASRTDGRLVYAESWALVHMLSLSPFWRGGVKGRATGGMPQFVKLLADGQPQEEAFRAAFGKSMADALVGLRVYLTTLGETTVPLPRAEAPGREIVTRVAPVDSVLMLAELALRTEHPDLARLLYQRAAKEHPESPAAVAGLGTLARIENREDEARRDFAKALAMGYRDTDTYFQLALITKDDSLLEKALAIDPDFAEAHFLLGVHATDQGDYAAAIDHLRRALAQEPRRFTFWHALGYAQAKAGDRKGAAESARRAAAVAVNESEEKMASALSLLAAEPAPSYEKKADAVTPASWTLRKGDTRAEGTITQVGCDASPVKIVVSTQTGTIGLIVQNPKQVELVNADGASTALPCGKQARAVAVEYIAATREITRIEFKTQVIMNP